MTTAFDDMTDDLDFAIAPPAVVPTVLYTEVCPKCKGSGTYYGPSRYGVACFSCNGAGKVEFKTSPEYRQARRERAAKSVATKAAQRLAALTTKIAGWKAANPQEAAWIERNTGRFDFATQMEGALGQWGSLTDGQLGGVRKCIDRDEQRAAEQRARVESAPVIAVERIEAAFATAVSNGLSRLRLHLDAFTFKPAKTTSANPGAVYVTEGERYLGKVLGGKFLRVRECSEDEAARIIAAAGDPQAAAIAYGKLTGRCSVCNRELTDPTSIAAGIGPICATGYGW